MNRQPMEYATLEYPNDMLSLIRSGLRRVGKQKRIIIAGAGMAGLVAASLLKQAGHHVTILEGNHRIGGRIFTVRAPFTSGNYLDVGAMRIPSNHKLVFEYIERFKLPINKFINSTPRDLFFVNNILTTRANYEQHPDVLGFPLEKWEKGKTAIELFLTAVQPFIDLYKNSTPEEQEKIKEQYAHYSMQEFLISNPLGPSLSMNAIRKISVILGIEGFKELSFVGIVTDIIFPIFNENTMFFEITGGNEHLPLSFLPELHTNILFNERVEQIIQEDKQILFQTRNQNTGRYHTYCGDYAITTIPYTIFQLINVIPYQSISFKKWQAIRELQNLAAVKVGIEFKHRFWEKLQVGNIITDRPIRFSYIPSHNVANSETGVLLASYSWGHDAMLWNSLHHDEITYYSLLDLAKIYGDVVYKEYMQSFSFNWSKNQFSGGCFTLFTPGQINEFGDFIYRSEGRLHFAGEHTSSFHGWIEGAIESGIRAAFEVNER